MMPICEICKKRIEERNCIYIDPFDHRYAHTYCFRKIISGAFQGIIGIYDDEIDEMVADACEDMLTGHTPSEVEEPIYDGSV
jgi:hypothetical protein